MLEQIDYIEKNGGAVIVRCYGSGPAQELPEQVAGLAVTELADHCFAKEASVRISPGLIRRAVRQGEEFAGADCRAGADAGTEGLPGRGDGPVGETEMPAICGDELRFLRLPGTLKAVGDYAFYGCSRLETVIFPAGLVRLGGGAFVACNHVREVVFSDAQTDTSAAGALLRTPPCMRDVLAEISYEVEIVLTDGEGKDFLRLLFPGYFEESKENTPARIIEVHYLGTGYPYRQCVRGGFLDLQAYDAENLFYLASVNEFPLTVVRLALDRLMTPVHLSGEAKARYLGWLGSAAEETADYVLETRDTGLLRELAGMGYFSGPVLDVFLKKTGEKKDAAALSFLMELSHGQRPAQKKKKYSFD